ncbi:unnamed protein product [Amaranthus hypochondriacus]
MAVISSSDFDAVFLQQGLYSACWLPVELHIVYLSSLVNQSICVNTRAIHVPVILRDTNIIKEESEHVQTLRMMREEIHDPPILLDVGFRIGLEGVHHIREFHSITDKKYGEVVPHQIKVPLQSIKTKLNIVSN